MALLMLACLMKNAISATVTPTNSLRSRADLLVLIQKDANQSFGTLRLRFCTHPKYADIICVYSYEQAASLSSESDQLPLRRH